MGALLNFIAFFLILCFIPGLGITIPLHFPLFSKERVTVGFLIGILYFTVVSVLFLNLRFFQGILPLTVIFDLSCLYFLYQEYQTAPGKKAINWKTILFPFLIIFLGTVFFSWNITKNGIYVPDKGVVIYSLVDHDSYWHLAIQNEVLKNIPPEQPGFAGELLKNYHYLSDVYIASFTKVSGLNHLDVFFRYLPVLLSFLYGLSVYVLTSQFTKKRIIPFLSVLFAYFSANAAYLVPFINKDVKSAGEGTFMLDQPFTLINNLHTLLAIELIMGALICLSSLSKKSKIILISLLIGISAGFKIYPAIVIILAIFLLGAIDYLKKRKRDLIAIALLSGIIMLVTIFPSKGEGGFPFIFAPFWLLRSMVQDPDRYFIKNVVLEEMIFREHHNYVRIVIMTIERILIYTFGNLFMRIFGLFSAVILILKNKNRPFISLLLISTFISITVPILFGQRGSIYNILQFGSIGIVFASIMTPLILENLRPKIAIIIGAILLFLSLPVSLDSFIGGIKAGPIIIPNSELALLKFLEHDSSLKPLLLYPNWDSIKDTRIIALTGKQTFYSGEPTARLLNKPWEERTKEILEFFIETNKYSRKKHQIAFLKKYNIDTVYLKNSEISWAKQIMVNKTLLFKNESGAVYRLSL